MVLPKISTNVSVLPVEPEANPVQQFLDSINNLRALPYSTIVLPSHGKPFRGLLARISKLHEHHNKRLAQVAEACAIPQSANYIVPILLLRTLDAHQMIFAIEEALGHLHKLWFDGVLERLNCCDGIIRFNRAIAN